MSSEKLSVCKLSVVFCHHITYTCYSSTNSSYCPERVHLCPWLGSEIINYYLLVIVVSLSLLLYGCQRSLTDMVVIISFSILNFYHFSTIVVSLWGVFPDSFWHYISLHLNVCQHKLIFACICWHNLLIYYSKYSITFTYTLIEGQRGEANRMVINNYLGCIILTVCYY